MLFCIFTARKRSLGQGNILHLSVILRGGVPGQVHPPGRSTPPGQVPPRQVHPLAGTTPPRQEHPLTGTPPRQVHTPVADPGFSKWGGTVLSQMGGHTSCFQVKSA